MVHIQKTVKPNILKLAIKLKQGSRFSKMYISLLLLICSTVVFSVYPLHQQCQVAGIISSQKRTVTADSVHKIFLQCS